MANKQKDKVTIPKKILQDLISSKKSWEENLNELEDYLILNNTHLLEKIEEGLGDIEGGDTEKLNKIVEDLEL